jgi:D-sedoheptulose 7-phosphate isomerase
MGNPFYCGLRILNLSIQISGGSKMSSSRDALITSSIQDSIKVKEALLEDNVLLTQIADVIKEFVSALSNGHKILLFGNGGSAADAQHIAAEFVGRFQMERTPLPALALTVNTSALTGIGNDYAYENVFSRQIEALGQAGDVAVGITTSGKSPNVIKALAAAKAKGIVTVALTGKFGTLLHEVSKYCLCVPSDQTPRIQESHILIGHIVSQVTELELFAK